MLPLGRREDSEGRPKCRRGAVVHCGGRVDGRSEGVPCIWVMVRTAWFWGRFRALGWRKWVVRPRLRVGRIEERWVMWIEVVWW